MGKFAQEMGKRGFVPAAYLTRNQSGGGLPGGTYRAISKRRKTGQMPGRPTPPASGPAPGWHPKAAATGRRPIFRHPLLRGQTGLPPKAGKREGMVEECNIIV